MQFFWDKCEEIEIEYIRMNTLKSSFRDLDISYWSFVTKYSYQKRRDIRDENYRKTVIEKRDDIVRK